MTFDHLQTTGIAIPRRDVQLDAHFAVSSHPTTSHLKNRRSSRTIRTEKAEGDQCGVYIAPEENLPFRDEKLAYEKLMFSRNKNRERKTGKITLAQWFERYGDGPKALEHSD